MSSVRKRVLVTGGAGFLGSHLCERLIARGDDVLCVDNYFTGRKDNVAQLLGDPNFEAMRHDITHPLFDEVDEIYNLACPASPIHYQFDPVQTTKTSVIGAITRQCQPDWPARLLRRRQALRRDPVLRLFPPAQSADPRRPHLQHLWAAHAPQ